jgi:hypothetical protein
MRAFQKLLLMLAATVTAGLLFVNIYNSVVDAPNWGHDIPASLNTAREYFAVANAGTFFRVVSPANQILGLLALIFCWRRGTRVRIYCAIALAFAVGVDIFTFAYFYPRLYILFGAFLDPSVDVLKAAWSEWSSMNWVRSAIGAIGLIFDFAALSIVSKPPDRP